MLLAHVTPINTTQILLKKKKNENTCKGKINLWR